MTRIIHLKLKLLDILSAFVLMVTVLGYACHYLSNLANILLQMERNCMILSSRWRSSSPLNKYVYLDKRRNHIEMMLSAASPRNIAVHRSELTVSTTEARSEHIQILYYCTQGQMLGKWYPTAIHKNVLINTRFDLNSTSFTEALSTLWKRRCHSENASNVLRPNYERGTYKRHPSTVMLDLWLRKTRSQSYCRDAIVFQMVWRALSKALFQKCFSSTRKQNAGVSEFFWFEKRFRDGLVSTLGLNVERKLRFEISLA